MSSHAWLQRIDLESLQSCTAKGEGLGAVCSKWNSGSMGQMFSLWEWSDIAKGEQGGGATSILGETRSLTVHSPELPDLTLKLVPPWAGIGVGTSCQPQPFSASVIYRSKVSVIKLSFYRSIFIMKIHCFMSSGISNHSLFRKSLSSNYTRS